MAINPLAAALQARAHLLPRSALRVKLARRAAARQSAAALRAAPEDPAVLAALGLYDAALERPAMDREGRFAHLLALAGTGQAAAAVAMAARLSPGPAEMARVARALAPFAPATALLLAPAGEPLLRAALAFAGNDADLTARSLAAAPASAERFALAAATAARGKRWSEARHAIADMFMVDGLSGPLDLESDRPISFAALVSERQASTAARGPLVTVAVPMRNAAATLDYAIASLRRQSWRDLEILLVDDGSEDDGVALAHRLAGQDERVRLLANDRESGVAGARNTAIAAARGEFLLFHDADDWVHPASVARLVAATAAGAGARSRHVRMDEAGVLGQPLVTPFVRYAQISLLVRTDIARRIGPIDAKRVGSDSEYSARLDLVCGRSAVVRDPAVLSICSWRPSSLSGDPRRGLGTIEGMRERRLYRAEWMQRHAAMTLPRRRFWLSRS